MSPRYEGRGHSCLCKKNMALFLTHLEAETCLKRRAAK